MDSARQATSADIETVEHLRCLAATEISARRGGVMLDQSMTAARALSSHSSSTTIVGLIDTHIVGFGAASISKAVGADTGLVAVIDELYVEPEARRVGVGSTIFSELLRWCSEQGCTAVDAVALPGDRGAKSFFESFSFKARLLVMHHELAGEGEQER